MGSALNKAGKVNREKADIERAEDQLAATREKLAALEQDFEAAIRDLDLEGSPSDLPLEEVLIRPRKSDLEVAPLELHWLPYLEPQSPSSRSARA